MLVQNNPLIRDDELGLLSEHGLVYLATDPAVVLLQPDGDILVVTANSPPPAGSSHTRLRAADHRVRGGLVAAHHRYDTDVPGLFLAGVATRLGGYVSRRRSRSAARTILDIVRLRSTAVMGRN